MGVLHPRRRSGHRHTRRNRHVNTERENHPQTRKRGLSRNNPADTLTWDFTLFCLVFNFFKWNWRIIALQYWVGFCCTSTWISRKDPYALVNLYPKSPLRATGWAPCIIQQLPTSYLFYTWSCLDVNATLSICFTLPSRHHAHKSVPYVCISIPALQIGSSVLFFQISYMLIYNICFSLFDLFYSV